MKVYWFYYKQIFLMNLGLSFILSILPMGVNMGAMSSMISAESMVEGLKKLPLVFATFGFFISIGVESFFYKRTNFLYYNLGFSKRNIVVGAFLINTIATLFLLPLLWI